MEFKKLLEDERLFNLIVKASLGNAESSRVTNIEVLDDEIITDEYNTNNRLSDSEIFKRVQWNLNRDGLKIIYSSEYKGWTLSWYDGSIEYVAKEKDNDIKAYLEILAKNFELSYRDEYLTILNPMNGNI